MRANYLLYPILLCLASPAHSESVIGAYFDSDAVGADLSARPGRTVNFDIHCAEDLGNLYSLARVGDLFDFSVCNLVEITAQVDGEDRSLFVEPMKLQLDPAAHTGAMNYIAAPNCLERGSITRVDSSRMHYDGWARVDEGVWRVGMPIFRMLIDIGQPSECLRKTIIGIRCVANQPWHGDFELDPVGAVVEFKGKRICGGGSRCEVHLMFCDEEEERMLLIRMPGYVALPFALKLRTAYPVRIKLNKPAPPTVTNPK